MKLRYPLPLLLANRLTDYLLANYVQAVGGSSGAPPAK